MPIYLESLNECLMFIVTVTTYCTAYHMPDAVTVSIALQTLYSGLLPLLLLFARYCVIYPANFTSWLMAWYR